MRFRLKASPEYKRWVGKRRRERVTYALTSASTMRAVAMLVIAAAAFWAGQITPPSALPEILQPSLAPAEPYLSAQAQSELQLQLEIEQGLANGYSSRVERLSARIASLQTEHAAELRDMRREVQTEHAARFQDMRSQLETEHAAELQDMRSRLEAEHAAGLQDMRSQLERLQTRLAHAQEVRPPAADACESCLSFPVKVACCLRFMQTAGAPQLMLTQDTTSDSQSAFPQMSAILLQAWPLQCLNVRSCAAVLVGFVYNVRHSCCEDVSLGKLRCCITQQPVRQPAHALQANPPSSVLSATNLCIVLALLAATSAATFWFSAERYAKEQLQEIEDLRLEAEAREVRPGAPPSVYEA